MTMVQTRQDDLWKRIRQHAPSWALSVALHAAILGPLCLITWVVAEMARPEPVLSIAPEGAGIDVAVGEGDGEFAGGAGAGGAAGSGRDTAAVGKLNDAYSMPPLGAPPGAGEGTAWSTDPVGGLASLDSKQAGSPFGSGSDPAAMLIRNPTGKAPGLAGGGGLGGMGDLMRGTSIGFGEYIGALRGRGLEIVLVLDATDSMSPYIKQAKVRLNEILYAISGLVPAARIGIVAYKDYGDDYGPTACKGLKITGDANQVRTFLGGIIAGGGGDEPEPINEALKLATDRKAMGWTENRKRVIILVGDSTIHPSGRQEAFRLAKAFADGHGTVNVIDPGGSGDQGARRAQVQPDLSRIAKDGGGVAFLLVEEKEFWQHLIVSVFGDRYKADVDMIIRKLAKKE